LKEEQDEVSRPSDAAAPSQDHKRALQILRDQQISLRQLSSHLFMEERVLRDYIFGKDDPEIDLQIIQRFTKS
jgi:hypothetical protein